MRRWLVACTVLFTGCGYIGPPLPPALKQPVRVTDLSAVERGAKIVIRFTVPKVTTENLPIQGPQDLELRIGVSGPGGFQLLDWLKDSQRVPSVPQDKPIAEVRVDTTPYTGKTVVIMLRARGSSGHDAGWSNAVVVPVVPALGKPQGLEAKDTPDAVELTWHAAALEFRVFRRTAGSGDWTQLGTQREPVYSDTTIVYGRSYEYYVQAAEKTAETYAESEPSETIRFQPADKFPPAVPAGLTAVPGARTIELSWERNSERDFASYRVYRAGTRVADSLTAAAYSDREATPGTTYQYQVSAVDTAGNESAKSAPVDAVIP